MLPLAAILRKDGAGADSQDAIDALTTMGCFVERRIPHLANKGLPESRAHLIELLRARS